MRRQRNGEKGIALVMALIISLVAFIVVGTTLYLVTQSVTMSGAGKTYATAEECSDGAVMIAKEVIIYVQNRRPPPDVFTSAVCEGQTTPLQYAIMDPALGPCKVTLYLPGAAGTSYEAQVIFQKLFAGPGPGGRIVFGESGEGAGKAIKQFYRLVTRCENRQTGASAENSVFYRFVPE
jgi:hypothetical protein